MIEPRRTSRASARGPATSRAQGGSRARRATEPSGDAAARTCIGCAAASAPEELVRLVLDESPDAATPVVVDARGGAFGRGAWLHARPECIAMAAKRGLARAFRREMAISPSALAAAISVAFERRLLGLVSGGLRAGHVVVGTEAVCEASREGRAPLVFMAADAEAAVRRREIIVAIGEGRALAWSDRAHLAKAVGRPADALGEGVALIAVTEPSLAAAARRAWLTTEGARAPAVPEQFGRTASRGAATGGRPQGDGSGAVADSTSSDHADSEAE
jgi:predicted RNA-binding protein YlxR (DUF448 family)